jgi:hypothetical protein
MIFGRLVETKLSAIHEFDRWVLTKIEADQRRQRKLIILF